MAGRRVGADGPLVGPVGLGCMSMSWAYEGRYRDDDVSVAVIRSALDQGVTFYDTADIYGGGHNEELVGRALRKHRHEVTLATKVGLVVDDELTRDWHPDGRPSSLVTAVDASLYRLGDEVIDLCYLHRADPRVPLAESWGTLASLVERGKIRRIGLSEVTADQAAEAHAIHPVAAIQSEFSLWARGPLEDVVGWCQESGAAFVPFAPLGQGALTGAVTAAARPSGGSVLDVVRTVAQRHRATPAQIAIAWTLAQGDHVIPIPGTKQRRYLEENLGAVRVELTKEDLDELAVRPSPVGSSR